MKKEIDVYLNNEDLSHLLSMEGWNVYMTRKPEGDNTNKVTLVIPEKTATITETQFYEMPLASEAHNYWRDQLFGDKE